MAGLKNLKSIFSYGAGTNKSRISGRHGGYKGPNEPPHNKKHSELDNIKPIWFSSILDYESDFGFIENNGLIGGRHGIFTHIRNHSIFDDKIGGIFNQVINTQSTSKKYSTAFMKINIPQGLVMRLKKEARAAKRNTKFRLSNIKMSEIIQSLRGKSKQIKH